MRSNPTDITRWLDPATNLICIVLRGPFGSYNGYVAITKEHPLFGIEYNDCVLPTAKPRGPKPDDLNFGPYFKAQLVKQLVCDDSWCEHCLEGHIEVHGGLTYSGHLMDEPETLWFFGFDTAHYCDYSPGLPFSQGEGVFRSKTYVENETRKLAVQLYDFNLEEFLEEVKVNAGT